MGWWVVTAWAGSSTEARASQPPKVGRHTHTHMHTHTHTHTHTFWFCFAVVGAGWDLVCAEGRPI